MSLVNSLLLLLVLGSILMQTLSVRQVSRTGANFAASGALYTAVIGLAMLPLTFLSGGTFSWVAVWTGALFGVAFIVCMRCYSAAMSCGPLSFTVFFFSSSMLVPVLCSVIIWKEALTAGRIIGVLLFLVALYLIQVLGADKANRPPARWYALCIGAFLANGLLGVFTRTYTESSQGSSPTAYICIGFFAASLTCLCLPEMRKPGAIRLPRASWLPLVGLALSTGVLNVVITILTARVPGTILFPLVGGGLVVLSTLVSVVFFKEKISRGGIVGLFVGLLAVICINF